ncbi:cytochrome P450 83B1-like [Glycine soja]|uniref:Cytochrome P450 83B1 n=1 Tax=Glycine soja TaxID=3848 RepID=A0A0B2PI14_GLYSO|nr:cytochrome P450 83B1-like [Glycine soja]KHN09046.1 Cytochrome P450 83B1 [Glycine soja]RZB80127.1 Cytochrome P450 83B1 [Glycine soja]
MLPLVYILIALPAVVLLLILFKANKNNPPRPPGPRGLPIIGNLHQLDASKLNLQLGQLSKTYGPLFSLRIGFKPALVVSSPKLAKEVLKDHDLDVCTRPPSLGPLKLTYNALELIFSPYNDHWREIRKICVVHFFSSKRISAFSHVRKSEAKRMLQIVSSHVDSSKTTNLTEVLMAVSSAIICRLAFGRKYDDDGAEKSRFHGLLNDSQAMLLSFFVSDYIPFLGWIDKLTGMVTRLEKTFEALDRFLQEVLDEHLDPNRVKVKQNEEKDLVDLLLELKKQGRLSIDLTDDQIKAIILDILIAGTDTTAATSVWVMTGLIKNPRAMGKAQEEIRNLSGNKELIEEEDVQKLVYLKAVIKETLRVYAPTPLVPREAIRSFTIEGYEIQPKTIVYVNGWSIQRDPEAWKDPEEFYPERFLNNEIDFKGQDFEFIPFGAGRRICPGISLGIATVELITANLLNSFHWEMPQGMKPEHIDTEGLPGLARHKKNHLCLVAKKRM